MTKSSNSTKVAVLEALLDSFQQCNAEHNGPCVDIAKSGKGTVFYNE